MIKLKFTVELSNLQDNIQVDDFTGVKTIIETKTVHKINKIYY